MPITAITASKTRITGQTAVNVGDRFWLLVDRDANTVAVHEVDPANTVDDITLGRLAETCGSIESAIERVAASVALHAATRARIADLLAA